MTGHAWSLVFYLAAAFYLVGAIAWLVISHCEGSFFHDDQSIAPFKEASARQA
jgi:hypothetical protein